MGSGSAVITGGAGTLGLAMAHALQRDGWKIRLIDRAEALESFSVPDGMEAVALDVTDEASCRRFFEELDELSLLVNSAGNGKRKPFLEMGLDEWRSIYELNVTAPFFLSQLAVPLLAKNANSSIINITSIAGKRAGYGRVAYGTTKAALEHLTRQAAIEFAVLGVRCNAVAPGPVASKLVEAHLKPEDLQDYLNSIPQNRLARPEEVAEAVAFLASNHASYITGECLMVDGGWLAAGAAASQGKNLRI